MLLTTPHFHTGHNEQAFYLQSLRRTGKAGREDRFRRGIVQSLMGTQGIIEVDILADLRAQVSGRMELIDIDQLRLQRAKPALNHDIVGPAGFAVHALANVQVTKQALVFVTGKLTALIRIEDSRSPAVYNGPHVKTTDEKIIVNQYFPD